MAESNKTDSVETPDCFSQLCTLEFLDRTTIRCVEDYAKIGLPLDAEAVLLMETDGHPVVVEEEAARMIQLAKRHRARDVRIAGDAAEADKLTSARRAAFSALARVSPTTILEDATVPRSELATMIAFIQQTAEKYKLKIGTFGHFGDGNLHPTFLCDERNHEEIERVHAAFREIFEKAIALGGTITGEHGVGLAKKEFLEKFAGTTSLDVMRALKRTLDPNNVLNPGRSLTEPNLLSQLDYSVLQQCIHCGMCLPTCPTYEATKHETSSPRGRIALMRAVADGQARGEFPAVCRRDVFLPRLSRLRNRLSCRG